MKSTEWELPTIEHPMERLRGGIWYSTAEHDAEVMETHTHGLHFDPDYFEETLYRSTKIPGHGTYFLVGRGNAESPWGVTLIGPGSPRAPGKNLRVLANKAAVEEWRRARASFGTTPTVVTRGGI